MRCTLTLSNLIAGLALPAAAMAQVTLGELLDAGAKSMTADEFRHEVVQRTISGPTPAGGNLEIVYVQNGDIQGRGSVASVSISVVNPQPVSGSWRTDGNDRICTTLAVANFLTLTPRCQYWFRLRGDYYVADSDWDRSAKVLRRIVKQ